MNLARCIQILIFTVKEMRKLIILRNPAFHVESNWEPIGSQTQQLIKEQILVDCFSQ